MDIPAVTSSEYRFTPKKRLGRLSFRLSALLFLTAGLLAGTILLVETLQKIETAVPTPEPKTLLFLPLSAVIIGWVILSASTAFVTSTDYLVNESGIILKITSWWLIPLTWADIAEGQFNTSRTYLPYRSLEAEEKLYVVTIPALPLVHRLAALYYGFGVEPMLIITPDHSGQEELAERLRAVLPEDTAPPDETQQAADAPLAPPEASIPANPDDQQEV